MHESLLISVIIPVYNGEQFIDRAVQSVLCQMDGSIELILVDDGSKDQSGPLCDAYAAKYPHIRVIHKENGGLSSARNAGIASANGEYLLFLDVDDFLEPETCERIIAVITSYHPDCIDFGWKYVSSHSESTHNLHKLPKNILLDHTYLKTVILPPLLNLCNDPDHFIYDFSCTKVFRRDIVQTNIVAFDENRRIWEDRPFVVQYLKHCKNFYSMDCCFYNYVDIPGSLSRTYSMDFFRIIIENFHLYKHLFGEEYDFNTQYVNDYWCHAIENMIFRSLEQKENREQIRENILDVLKNEQVIHWYSKRIPANRFEKTATSLVIAGHYSKALYHYSKELASKQKKQHIDRVIHGIKNRLKKVLSTR